MTALSNKLEDMISQIRWKIKSCMWTIIPVRGLNKCKAPSNLLLGKNPHRPIIHGGTNDRSTKQQPQQIAKSIVELALSIKRHNSQKRWPLTKSCRDKPSLEEVMQRKEYFFDTAWWGNSNQTFKLIEAAS